MNDIYYKLPVSFFDNEKYDDLSFAEKCMYSVLYARYDLSRKNGKYTDEDGTFVVYTVQGLMNYMKIGSKHTVVNGLKHLEEHGLIVRKKGRQGQPDKVYIKEVEVKGKPIKTNNEKIEQIFVNIGQYLTSSEMKRLEGLLMSLALKKRDAYKIDGEYIPTDRILNRILLLSTSEIVEVFQKMREASDVKNYFMYLLTALYNAYEE